MKLRTPATPATASSPVPDPAEDRSPRFRSAIAAIAADQDRSPRELMGEARKYMKELISTPSALFLDLRARLERFMMTQGYDKGFRTDPAELEALRPDLEAVIEVAQRLLRRRGPVALGGAS